MSVRNKKFHRPAAGTCQMHSLIGLNIELAEWALTSPEFPFGSSSERQGFKASLSPAPAACGPAVHIHTIDGIIQFFPISSKSIPYYQPYQSVMYIRNIIPVCISSPGLKQHDYIAFHPVARHPQHLRSLTFCSYEQLLLGTVAGYLLAIERLRSRVLCPGT